MFTRTFTLRIRWVYWVTVALLLFSFFRIGKLYPEGRSAHYYKEMADRERQQKNRLKAIDFYKKSLQENPDFVPSLIALGALLREIGSLDDSRNYLQRAYDLDSKNKTVLLELSRTLIEQNDIRLSEKILEEGVSISAHDPDLNFLQAQLHINEGRIYLAQMKIENILKNYPNHAPSLIALGDIYLQQKRFALANQVFEKARLADPENPDVFISMARVSFERILDEARDDLYGREADVVLFDKPILYLSNAKEFDNDYVPANLLLGKIYAMSNRCDLASKYFANVLEINKNHLNALYYQGICRPRENIDLYYQLLEKNQNNEVLRYSLENNLILYSERRENQKLMELAQEHYDHAQSLFKANMNHRAVFEMNWARYLYPSYLPVHKALFDYYRSKRDFVKMAHELDYLRRETDDVYYQDLYEVYIEKRKEKLYYREGIADPIEIKTLTPLYVFRFKPENFLGDYPDAGKAVAQKLVFALQDMGRINVLSGAQRKEISSQLYDPNRAGQGLYYNAASGKQVKEYYKKVLADKPNAPSDAYLRYVIDGSYREIPGGLEVMAHIVDLETGITMFPFKMRASGRGHIRDIVLLLADHIYEHIPFHGKIVKVTGNGVIVNLGFREGISKETKLGVYRDGVKLTDLSVDILDTDILWAKPEVFTDIYRVQPGDLIFIEKETEPEIEKKPDNP